MFLVPEEALGVGMGKGGEVECSNVSRELFKWSTSLGPFESEVSRE